MTIYDKNLYLRLRPLCFDNEGWKLKVDDDGKPVMKEGRPVFLKPDGAEFPADVASMYSKITELTTENQKRRETNNNLEDKLKAFDGIDVEKAKTALDTVSKIDQKKLIDAGKVDEVKAEIVKQYDEKLAKAAKDYESLQSEFHGTLKKSAFTGSKYIAEKLAVPPDMVAAMFADKFKIEDGGKLVAYNGDMPVTDPDNPGNTASFEKAIEVLVNGYSHKEMILKGNNQSGSGGQGGNGGGGKTSYSRADFDKLNPAKRAEVAQQAREGKAEILDD